MKAKKVEVQIDIDPKAKKEIIERFFTPAIHALLEEIDTIKKGDSFELYLVKK